MSTGLLTMSDREIERVTVIKRITEKQLKQSEGAKLLKLSSRQIRRLVKDYRRLGSAGLISKRRGKVSNRYKGDDFKEQIRQLVSQHYYDFGPTFAAEKLLEVHGLKISKERLLFIRAVNVELALGSLFKLMAVFRGQKHKK
jgi:transposase